MQFIRSNEIEGREVTTRPARTVLCDHCRSVLGDKRVLTRDGEGQTRRFCGEDNVCLEAWRRYNRSVFGR